MGYGERSNVGSIEVLQKLSEESDSEDVRMACDDALKALEDVQQLRNRLKKTIPVPCQLGDELYSIIGEKVKGYRIDGFRIDEDNVYMTSEDIFFPASKIGTYYFFTEPVAQVAFEKMYKGVKTG